MAQEQHILVVEDERAIASFLRRGLVFEGYRVTVADTGARALDAVRDDPPDLIILDIMLPGDIDGLEVCRRIRAAGEGMPILMLTARDEVADRVAGLDAGADDYLVKPFAMPELLARIRVLLRRAAGSQSDGEISYGALSVKSQTMEGYVNGEPLRLTLKEFELLEYLLLNREQILTKEQLLDRVWGIDSEAGPGVVDVYIHYLRKKLAPFGCDRFIHTVRGIGYMLKESG